MVQALGLSADDYVSKPFSMEELPARLRATTRRASTMRTAQTVAVGQMRIDLAAKTVTEPDGGRVHLTPTEWHLLERLLRQPELVTEPGTATDFSPSAQPSAAVCQSLSAGCQPGTGRCRRRRR